MTYRQFNNTYIVRLDKGDELVESIKTLCQQEHITLGKITGLGATDRLTVGLFDPSDKAYHKQELTGNYEITSLIGNISEMNGEIYLHIHIAVSDITTATFGGHLNAAYISATGELIIEKLEGHLDRKFSDEIGLNLYEM